VLTDHMPKEVGGVGARQLGGLAATTATTGPAGHAALSAAS
jgi:hypothetical protein